MWQKPKTSCLMERWGCLEERKENVTAINCLIMTAILYRLATIAADTNGRCKLAECTKTGI